MSAAVILAAAMALAPPAASPAHACLSLANSSTTTYRAVDDHTVVIDSGRQWFKLTTTPSSSMLWPQSYFINDIRGTSSLCSRLDFQLYVVDGPGGIREPLIVQEFEPIAADEGKALLKAARR